jgi:hypothetical protein
MIMSANRDKDNLGDTETREGSIRSSDIGGGSKGGSTGGSSGSQREWDQEESGGNRPQGGEVY